MQLGRPKLLFLPYDLERRTWGGSEPTELETPDDKPFPKVITLLQSASTATPSPPLLYVQFPDGSDGTRSLNQAGKQWDKADFVPVHDTQLLAQRADGSRHAANLDDEPISPQFPYPSFERIMKWLTAADDFAKNANPPFACGFPDFKQDGDRFGVIAMTKTLVDVVPAGAVFDNAYQPFTRFEELTQLWRNATANVGFAGAGKYQAAFPLFAKQGSSWICERVAFVKLIPGIGLGSGPIYSFQTDLASPARALRDADNNPTSAEWEWLKYTASVMQSSSAWLWFGGADFAGRFLWADQLVTTSNGPDFLALPTFSDRGLGVGNNQDAIGVFPRSQDHVTTVPPDAVSESVPDSWAPSFSGSFAITPDGVGPGLQARRAEEANAYAANALVPASLLEYFDEAWYFVPMHIGLQLQRSGNYREALDWFRIVFDYSAPAGQRKIAAALVREQAAGAGFQRGTELAVAPRPSEPASDRADAIEHVHPLHAPGGHPVPAGVRRERVYEGHVRVGAARAAAVRERAAAAGRPRARAVLLGRLRQVDRRARDQVRRRVYRAPEPKRGGLE